ncbi:MAG TPA: hypothetical protein VGR37_13395 [Longimicrobiaceae bacterium]|nr:hypothetical protein [Longimicrobiaceae bacterium]
MSRAPGRAGLEAAAARLRTANLAFAARYPGESALRQPVHTVYAGAHLFRHDSAARHGELALAALREYAPSPEDFAGALGIEGGKGAEELYARVVEKLEREPVEDFRLDFEDGYGVRPDAEEDATAVSAAEEVARGMEAGTLPAYVGLRLKSLAEETRERSVRTLDLFLARLLEAAGGRLPPGLLFTVPKVTIPEQAAFFADVLETLEARWGLAEGTLRFELMVEVPQAVIGADGRVPLPGFLDAARGRLAAAHFGTYDYTSGVGITAAHQGMRHPACDFARHVMQVAFAGTGVWLSDGSTAGLPVPVHEGPSPTDGERRENREAVHRAWRMHFDDVRHSLVHGFYQGWDLYPAQLPTRYAAVFAFFLAGRDAAAQRLRGFLAKAAQAGDAFDDPHAGQALLNYFLRGVGCGAFSEAEVLEETGLTGEELRGRSFAGILANR